MFPCLEILSEMDGHNTTKLIPHEEMILFFLYWMHWVSELLCLGLLQDTWSKVTSFIIKAYKFETRPCLSFNYVHFNVIYIALSHKTSCLKVFYIYIYINIISKTTPTITRTPNELAVGNSGKTNLLLTGWNLKLNQAQGGATSSWSLNKKYRDSHWWKSEQNNDHQFTWRKTADS